MIQARSFLPRRLLPRALLIIVVPLVTLQIVSGIIFYDRHWAKVSRYRTNSLAGEIAMIIDMARTGDGTQAGVVVQSARNMDLWVDFEADGVLPDSAWQPGGFMETTLARSLREFVRRPFSIYRDRERERVVISVQLEDEVVHVDADLKRVISSTTQIFILWMIGTSIVLFGLAAHFMSRQVTPIRRLARVADSFGKGRDVSGFHPTGAAEVRQAATAFLAMRNRIKRQIRQRTDMLAGVSHDLRTPLTRMKLQLALLKEDRVDVGELATDVAEMERMIDGYLDFARGEGGEEPVPADLAVLLGEAVRSVGQNDKLVLEAPAGLEIPVRRDAFRRCMANVLANANRFAQRITVTARRVGGRHAPAVEIAIDDDGPGIPADRREEAFRPFVRLAPGENDDHPGAGLGLAIARDIARGHGGDLRLTDSPLGGLRVLMHLPA